MPENHGNLKTRPLNSTDMKNIKLKGKLSISRPTYGDGRKLINITLVDEISGSEFLDLEIPTQQFAECLTGLSRVECEFEYRPDRVGLRYEHKTERVPFLYPFGVNEEDRDKAAKAACEPFETDGWAGDWKECLNGHKRGGGHATVIFRRWVQP